MLDGGPLFLTVGEETAREQFNDDKRIAEAVGVQWNYFLGRDNFDAETIVVEVDTDAENTVRATLGASAVYLLLFQTTHVVHVD